MNYEIKQGDCLESLRAMPDQSVHCCVTSPPYFGLRDYGHDGQIGLEETPEAYAAKMVAVFREVRRVLRDDGTVWLNLGDSYAGGGGFCPSSPSNQAGSKQTTHKGSIRGTIKPGGSVKAKDLIGIPWRVAFALQADGWYLRQDIIWHKPNPMPESVTDRCTKSHEYIFLLSKSARYYFDHEAIKEPAVKAPDKRKSQYKYEGDDQKFATKQGIVDARCKDYRLTGRNKRSVWTVTTKPFKGAHFAVFPPDLIRPCIQAGCPKGGTVLDPFSGSGTTGLVCHDEGRDYIGLELNPEYVAMSKRRLDEATAQSQFQF